MEREMRVGSLRGDWAKKRELWLGVVMIEEGAEAEGLRTFV